MGPFPEYLATNCREVASGSDRVAIRCMRGAEITLHFVTQVLPNTASLHTASKIMARKRPHLIPIEDSVVNRVIELGRGDSWRLWWEAFQAEGDYLEERAKKLRAEIGRPELSTLRVFDVMLWMWGKANLSA